MNVLRRLFLCMLLAGAGSGVAFAASAADPSTDEVYQAVRENRLDDAQAMMGRVLKDHPNSAQAHYVEAEVLVRMGRAEDARAELDQAERLEPGLPFARPSAVRSLQALIAERGARHESLFSGGSAAQAGGGIAWGGLLLVLAGVGLVLLLLARARRAAALAASGPVLASPGAGSVAPGYGPAYPYGAAPMGGPGLGSSIMGGLATGAAVGAGMVAGEALAHDLMGGRQAPPADGSRVAYDDAGGRDFGINDPDGWDSGGMGSDIGGGDAGGGGDWS